MTKPIQDRQLPDDESTSASLIPDIVILIDFDGYFEALARRLVATKTTPFKHREIRVTAGPWRDAAVAVLQLKSDPSVVTLDFYSALRNGFGELSAQDLKGIQDLL